MLQVCPGLGGLSGCSKGLGPKGGLSQPKATEGAVMDEGGAIRHGKSGSDGPQFFVVGVRLLARPVLFWSQECY